MPIQDSTQKIALNARHFFSGTMASRATGLVREVLMAVFFGAHASTAAFWMAFRFASLLRRVFGEGALHTAFVPHYELLQAQDPSRAARFFYDLMMGSFFVLLLLTVLGEGIMAAALIYWPMSPANQEIVRLTMLLFPSIGFISLFALNSSYLNCQGSFLLPSSAPAFFNLIWILSIFWVCREPERYPLERLALCIVAAFALQWGVTAVRVFPHLSQAAHEKRLFSRKDIVQILRPFALSLLGVTAVQINSALDALFARAADAEGPAYLWYALRLQQLPLALIGVGLTGALLPPIARAVERGEWERYRRFLHFALESALLWLLPISAAIIALGIPSVNLIYGHGQFAQNAVIITAHCLWAYGAALLPMTAVLIFASAFYARKEYRLPTLISIGCVLLNIFLNALLVFVFHLGAVSVALATTAASCINAFLLAAGLKTRYGFVPPLWHSTAWKVGSASLATLAAFFFLSSFLPLDPLSRSLSTQLFSFILQSALFCSLGVPIFSLLGLHKKMAAHLKGSFETVTSR